MMWKVMIRAAMAFGFSIFGRKVIALIGLILFILATAILFDLKMYVSAGATGFLAVAALILFFMQYRRQIVARRVRERLEAEGTRRRAAASEARSEKMGKAKAAVADTVKGMTAGAADVAKTGFAGARDRVQGWRK
jgi:membrane-bound ClpP family serine protease